MSQTYNYKVIADTAGPFTKGTVVAAEEIKAAGHSVEEWWRAKGGSLIEVTGAPPTSSHPKPKPEKKKENADAAGNQP